MKNIRLAIPDLDTQKAIAAFLDRETARIDRLIEKKERQEKALREKESQQFESLTFQSEWAEIEVRQPFKWRCRIPNGQVNPTGQKWIDSLLIAPNHIEQGTGRLLYQESAREQGAESGKYAFPAGTVVYSKIRPNLAKACIAPEEGLCSADMYPIIPSNLLRPEFLLMQLLSRTFTDWATKESMRVAMPKLNRETLGNFRLLVPAIETQDSAIRQWKILRERTEDVRLVVIRSIALLKEKRTALITAAVTGQIDLREQPPAIAAKPDRRLDAAQEVM